MRSGRARTFHSVATELGQPVVGHDHRDLGDVVELGIEATELAVHEGEGEFGQAILASRRARVALPTGIEPVSWP